VHVIVSLQAGRSAELQ